MNVLRKAPRLWHVAVGVLFALSACTDRSPTAATVEGVVVKEIILRVSDGSVVFSHIDHWHGAPVVRAGASVGIDLHFTAFQTGADNHDAPPVEQWFRLSSKSPEYNVRAVVEDTTIANWTNGTADRGSLRGVRAGASRISFVVRRGTATIYEAPPLNFRVQP